MKKKVLIGMSGGVDSSAAAGLLLEQGYQVEGATFLLWKPEGNSEKEVLDAKSVCAQLNIPHHVLDFQKPFRESVVENFVSEYQSGRTPSPCIECNKKIKFGLFYETAMHMGFDAIATGHYAQILPNKQGIFQLKTAEYLQKDQSYFLYGIPYEKLPHILFPLGRFTKPQVREIAQKYGFSVAKKKDSQEICFVDQKGYGFFLEQYTHKKPPKGNFVSSSGEILGEHKGIWYYTVGQRKGLGVSFGKPMYVAEVDPAKNTVCLKDDQEIYGSSMELTDMYYPIPQAPKHPINVLVKIRNRAPLAPATLSPRSNGTAKIEFDQPQRAITKGQSAVCYDGDTVIGGGIIIG